MGLISQIEDPFHKDPRRCLNLLDSTAGKQAIAMDRMMGLLGMLRWGFGGFESYSCFLFVFSRFSWMFIHVHRNSGPPLQQSLSIRNLNGFNG